MTIKIPETLGLPPACYTNKEIVELTMPTAKLHPCEPNFKMGMTLYSLDEKFDLYRKQLKDHGYECELPLKVAYLADNFPTDQFTNSYGESFLQKATDVVSEAAGEITQMMGARTASEAAKKISDRLKGTDNIAAKAIGSGISSAQKTASSLISGLGISDGTKRNMDALMARGRVDFPQVWKNSAFAPSYTMTVRLYNPKPANDESTKQYIIGPIAALMLLGIPRASSESIYSWPFMIKVVSPGIYNLNPGYIQNITVIKGGDQQSIALNQRLAMVDVRLDFGSLYNSILASQGSYDKPGRPTLKNYIKALETQREVPKGAFYKSEKDPIISKDDSSSDVEKNLAAGQGQTSTINAGDEPDSRVSSSSQYTAEQLADPVF